MSCILHSHCFSPRKLYVSLILACRNVYVYKCVCVYVHESIYLALFTNKLNTLYLFINIAFVHIWLIVCVTKTCMHGWCLDSGAWTCIIRSYLRMYLFSLFFIVYNSIETINENCIWLII